MWDKYCNVKSSGNAKWTLARAINTGVTNPSSFVGCHVGDCESYDDFKELFYPVIERYHNLKVDECVHVTDMDPSKIKIDLSESAKSKVISTRIRVGRNLKAFPLNPGGTK